MNNHFSFTRFSRVLAKHTAEYLKWYLMAAAVLTGAMTLILGFVAYMQSYPVDEEEQTLLFIFSLLGAGSVFTSTVFAHLGDKKKAMAALTLPASHFEKYLVAWLYSFLIFSVVFTLSFYLVVGLVLNLDNPGAEPVKYLNIFSTENEVYLVFLIFAFIHGIALWGSVFFQKLHFIKTAFAFFLGLMLLVFLNYHGLEMLLNRDLMVAMPFNNIGFQDKDQYYYLDLPEIKPYFTKLLPVVLGLIFWLAAYFGLKEKQV
ncbi:hypothetical protein [Adhaeribacter pallidiroseus]|uniref:Uncharacterized protein n=1 Tax=Adhaeribacter pallidiroseus TaxID=2072847 RepID=A0A369QHW1_9BACT|nr:hypothetical protein [Adhaeribacter pallidiroseus]RDC64012.1 hypothetical protein AHMF7616_02622 [Adhaeribacter pallidiroseus]